MHGRMRTITSRKCTAHPTQITPTKPNTVFVIGREAGVQAHVKPLGVLLQAPASEIVRASATAAIGVAAIAAGLSGWIRRAARPFERVGLAAGGLLLCYAGKWTDLVGLGVSAVVLVLHLLWQPPAHGAHNAS